MTLSRRKFIKGSAAGFGAAIVSTGLTACFGGDVSLTGPSSAPPAEATAPLVAFRQGVASGDPTPEGAIIWTRVTPVDPSVTSVNVRWEVATDSGFSDVIRNGETAVTNASDFTLKVDAQALDAGTSYYYRFVSGSETSPVGMLKTLPVGAVSQLKFAVFSCSNFPAGFFHVYAEAARRDDLDAVLHLGDYIYEYPIGGYATEDAVALGRDFPASNDVETVTLEDYRGRYAIYRTDTDLQALHQAVPFIAVWDDHEVTNDAFRDGAENHDDSEGDFDERKMAALQAYFEWMPIRPASQDDQETIFRRFDFGDLASLYMLDTRIIARDEQLNLLNYANQDGSFDATRFIADVTDPNRALLGAEQLGWLQSNMATSAATWQVLGQQVLMGQMTLPAEVILLLGELNALISAGQDVSALITQANVLFTELGTIKGRILAGDPTVTAEERARVETVLPYNLDAWDGYAFEREQVLGTAAALGKNLVVLAGDTHNAWASNLLTDVSNPVAPGVAAGVEFATASVSSPGLEAFFGLEGAPAEVVAQFEGVIQLLVDNLQYTNLVERGYMVLTLTPEQATADWIFVDTIKSQSYSELTVRNRTHSVAAGANTIS